MKLSEKRIVFIDMDDTLIKTTSGKTFPIGVYDMTLRLDVFAKIKAIAPNAVFIVSNQGGIEAGFVNITLFQQKFMYVIASLQEYVGLHTFVAGKFCPTQDAKFEGRKPNTAMLTSMLDEFEQILGHKFTKKDCVYIGDTLVDTEELTAKNFGCDFVPVETLLTMKIDAPMYRVVYKKDYSDFDSKIVTKAEATQVVREHTNDKGETELDIVPSKFIAPQPEEPKKESKPEVKQEKKSKVIKLPFAKKLNN